MATNRKFDARPDSMDFRDRMYEPTLIEVPTSMELERYLARKVPILDQGREGACTGYGLATVANYLLRVRQHRPDEIPVSARMLYEMARRYDEWPGEEYEGSSARGAMKAWQKHGVCGLELWGDTPEERVGGLTTDRASDAARRPLGSYSRVNHKDLVCMHTALSEVGILYATAKVHEGWSKVGKDGVIEWSQKMLGGHAFAIVGFTEDGFWIQNSWGPGWGREGFGLISYDDWLRNASDVWVARLGAPVRLNTNEAQAISHSAAGRQREAFTSHDLRPHIISLGNNGLLRETGPYGTGEQEVNNLFQQDIPQATSGWGKKRILLYGHGGLVDEPTAVQRIADYRATLLEREVYPLGLIWKSDYWTTLTNMLEDALGRRRPEGLLNRGLDFMLDRLDDALEPLARTLSGKLQWDEMKENARKATESAQGGARVVADRLAEWMTGDPDVELHVVGHSAGAILHAPLVQLLTATGKITSGPTKGAIGKGLPIASCTLWAPACTRQLFDQTYLPAIQSGAIQRFALFTLTDKAEQEDHCANIYHKSLLYLVSNAFEAKPRIPLIHDQGVPLLGMAKFLPDPNSELAEAEIKKLVGDNGAWVRSPNPLPRGDRNAAGSNSHGGFDNDPATLLATLAIILDVANANDELQMHRSEGRMRDQRKQLEAAA
jgi:hypothetical protein